MARMAKARRMQDQLTRPERQVQKIRPASVEWQSRPKRALTDQDDASISFHALVLPSCAGGAKTRCPDRGCYGPGLARGLSRAQGFTGVRVRAVGEYFLER